MEKYLFGPLHQELGQEILMTRPRILSAIKRLKENDPECTTTVLSFTGRGALYHTADAFLGYGTYKQFWKVANLPMIVAKVCNVKNYQKVDASSEPINPCGFESVQLKDEWIEKANEIVSEDFITISIRMRRDEGARNFLAWDRILEGLKDFKVICTSPRINAPDLKILFLEDLIGEKNKDSMGIEMALHANSKICVTTNTGSAGIMLLSNPQKVLIFGGTTGYATGWTGLLENLSKNNPIYRTKLISPPKNSSFHSIMQDKIKQIPIADELCKAIKKEMA